METNYDALIQASADELFQQMSSKEDQKNIDRLRAAFEFAREAHSPQRRKSGEPYIIHPVNVARIVAEELELGADPVIAAFLHLAEHSCRTCHSVHIYVVHVEFARHVVYCLIHLLSFTSLF
mgnify:CR=1 FL=1